MTKRGAKKDATATEGEEAKKPSNHVQRVLDERKKGTYHLQPYPLQRAGSHGVGADAKVDPLLESQFAAGRLYASISSRPGQSGRADGYILEGRELEVSKFRIGTPRGERPGTKRYAPFPVLPEEDQDGQAEARPRGIGVSRDWTLLVC